MRVTLCLLASLSSALVVAAARADGPATTQSAAPELSERQASILLQLANAEANIKAINKALVRTGYKVGLAYEQKEGAERGNELMDRKGGGPVPWDQFYGRTAMDFYHHASADLHYDAGRGAKTIDAHWTGGTLTKIDRPAQFDSIYRANDQQAARAQEQIASLLQDQAALLARRQKHEADQSALWAELSWERIKDREIGFRPLHRFKLTPAGPRAELLRGPILFLRTVDKAIGDELDAVEADQGGSFFDLKQRAKEAYAGVQGSLADALVADGLTADDRKAAEALKSLCKQVAEQCMVAEDNYKLALDSDRAKEDASKLEYRAQQQSSLAKLVTLVGALDEQVEATAAAWSIKPQAGTESPDKLPAAPPRPAATPSPVKEVTVVPLPAPAPASPGRGSEPERDRVRSQLTAMSAWWERPAPAHPKSIKQDDPLEGEADWAAEPSGRVISGAFQVGNDPGNHPGARDYEGHLVVEAGTEIDGGTIRGAKGFIDFKGTADRPVVCRNVVFEAELWSTLRADHAVFENCSFRNAGSWWGAVGYNGKWIFTNCVVHHSDFRRFNRADTGVTLENCAFVDCKFGKREWTAPADKKPDLPKLVEYKWNRVNGCDFYHCQVSVGAAWMARHCNFFACTVTDAASYPSGNDLPLELGLLPEDRTMIDDLRAKTTAAGAGRVTYSAAPGPYSNSAGLTR